MHSVNSRSSAVAAPFKVRGLVDCQTLKHEYPSLKTTPSSPFATIVGRAGSTDLVCTSDVLVLLWVRIKTTTEEVSRK